MSRSFGNTCGSTNGNARNYWLGSDEKPEELRRFPILPAYDLCLKCSHLFNLLDARGAISVTERVGIIARIRALAVGVAKAYVRMESALAPATLGSQNRTT